jgi:hypothetical protein
VHLLDFRNTQLRFPLISFPVGFSATPAFGNMIRLFFAATPLSGLFLLLRTASKFLAETSNAHLGFCRSQQSLPHTFYTLFFSYNSPLLAAQTAAQPVTLGVRWRKLINRKPEPVIAIVS